MITYTLINYSVLFFPFCVEGRLTRTEDTTTQLRLSHLPETAKIAKRHTRGRLSALSYTGKRNVINYVKLEKPSTFFFFGVRVRLRAPLVYRKKKFSCLSMGEFAALSQRGRAKECGTW